MFNPQNILERKSTLFSIIIAITVASLSIPVILPHLFHGFHIFHIFLHVGGIILSTFLSILSITAFYRLKTKKLLLTSIAFSMFMAAETMTLIDATWPFVFSIGDVPLLEVSHLLMITTLGLLAMGVFRND